MTVRPQVDGFFAEPDALPPGEPMTVGLAAHHTTRLPVVPHGPGGGSCVSPEPNFDPADF
ncbi:hypothetical protein NKH73_10150 [Mesorhizobium sp. M0938]|uniref:hypothetical protein n=1 Tax=unclassified Mesorhizobium TaxID=325217 RepID=UPI003335BF1A